MTTPQFLLATALVIYPLVFLGTLFFRKEKVINEAAPLFVGSGVVTICLILIALGIRMFVVL